MDYSRDTCLMLTQYLSMNLLSSCPILWQRRSSSPMHNYLQITSLMSCNILSYVLPSPDPNEGIKG